MDKRPLSEISHLFLSNVRDLPKPGAARPVRVPPGGPRIQRDESIDLTPEEFAQVFGQIDLDDDKPSKKPIVTAVLASHLSGSQTDRVKDYARHYAVQSAGRIGLIEVDASEFKLMTFEPGVESHAADDGSEGNSYDPRQMAEAIEEMNVDVDRWLLLVPNPRLPEARNLLRLVNHWVMLSTCDHDGVVSCYRTLKGLADLHRPKLSLALLDTSSEHEAGVIYRKLQSVCQQFLNWPLVPDAMVQPADNVAEAVVLNCRPLRDKAQLAAAPQWEIVADFLATAETDFTDELPTRSEVVALNAADPDTQSDAEPEVEPLEEEMPHLKASSINPGIELLQADAAYAESLRAETRAFRAEAARPESRRVETAPLSLASDDASDVVDLPSADASATTILSAVVRHDAGALVECPLRPPMAPEATLAVDRERGLVLLAVTKIGLSDLRIIAQAYQWLNQNRNLIAMAMPQFAIDSHRLPSLRLLVDHRDMTADLLQPMLEAGHVTVQAYRKLRWGAKAGLLLEAA